MGILDFFKRRKSKAALKHSLNDNNLMDLAMETWEVSHNGYWERFKMREPQVAESIDKVCDRDMTIVSDGAAFQIVTTFLRWSANSKTPIEKLKEKFVEQMKALLAAGGTYDMFLEKFKKEKPKEAETFNISEDNTISNYMFEWLLEMQSETEADAFLEQMARNMNVTDLAAFKANVKAKKEELNIAPDISKLDREENRLFALAKEGVELFREYEPMAIGEPAPTLTEGGSAEALILCSTMVVDLHSHFKNELNMNVQTDRFFLLLANDITSSVPDDVIAFINSRISFYKKECRDWSNMGPFDGIWEDNAIAHIYNALFISPISDNPAIIPQSLLMHDLLSFKSHFERVQRALLRGRRRIKGDNNAEDELREKILNTLNCVIAPMRQRTEVNQDMASVFSDVIINMVKEGKVEGQIVDVLPLNVKAQVQGIVNYYLHSSLSDDEREAVIKDAQEDFLKTFPD